MKSTPTRQALTALQSFAVGDRVCTDRFAAATVTAFNPETGDVMVRRARDNGEEAVPASSLIKIAGAIGERVPA